MNSSSTLCLIIPTYNRASALIGLLDSLNENISFLDNICIYINSSSDNNVNDFLQEKVLSLSKRLDISFVTSSKSGLSTATRESLLLAPGDYKAVIADDFLVYPKMFPKIIAELEMFKPYFYRSYFTGYHSHQQSSVHFYSKAQSILFAGQHLGIVYSAEAIKMLVESDALCFRAEHTESRELTWVHSHHWFSFIIAELLFLAMERFPKRFVSSGLPLAGFSPSNCDSVVAKETPYPYWHAGFFSEETWSIVSLISVLANRYPTSFNRLLESRLVNAYVFDTILKTIDFYANTGRYSNDSLFVKMGRLYRLFKYL